MNLVDSHCHLTYLAEQNYPGGIAAVIANAKAAGVTHLLSIGTRLDEMPALLDLPPQFPNVQISVGVHPTEECPEPTLPELLHFATQKDVWAIGETGLDFYRIEEHQALTQYERFRTHIACAKEVNKPLIVHTRAARSQTIALLKETNAQSVGGVLHCFTEDWAMAEAAIELGFYISISGIVTFKNAKEVQEVAAKVPLQNLLIETDSPFLAPVPHRGKANEPAYVRYVAEYIAALRGIPVATLAEATTNNFFRLFKKY